MRSELLVSYSPWRALVAIAFPLVAAAIPILNLVISPTDFHQRWIETWIGSAGFGIAIIWLVYVGWPYRVLFGGAEKVRIQDGDLVFEPGNGFSLRDLSAIEILRPWLKHPRIALQFGSHSILVETAFQTLGKRKSVEEIAETIAAAARAQAEQN
jgi:hypothetical protein